MLAGLAYERDLGRALGPLASEFGRWQRGEIDAFELSDKIHEFHNGTARDLYRIYTGKDTPHQVAFAMVECLVADSEVDADLRPLLEPYLAFVRAGTESK